MPIFPVPPVGPEDGGHIGEVVREMVGNRNYSKQERFGEGRGHNDDDGPRDRERLRARLRRFLRR